jgi:hypothetical protein
MKRAAWATIAWTVPSLISGSAGIVSVVPSAWVRRSLM